ncbi:iron chaperone [Yimella sp. cx-51]|uniref:iron chaperone n=1 Tax=Yimella sp. cx-51 TaxID=2770551 RepID=UPI00165E24B8|nr:DUF1801 domain-containing protein [Yimella sp. cx-51]MBC9957803.1 DUF1801 domain-containing protein [Yimella sp. cx-51]QTH36855.1 DUF1801 domain-containing protein [Yimella sp. cx-51]
MHIDHEATRPGSESAGSPIADYLETLTPFRAERIHAIYEVARNTAPEATEGVKYAMPALVFDGKGLLSVMSTKKHIGIYPYSSSVVEQLAEPLAALGVSTTKGAIQEPDSVVLPTEVVESIVRARLEQIRGR